ncbi:D-ala-D-ala transporter subunit [Paenibacillus pectinilyticus]|uniref:D-ala-D-ala transporter subunit n=1 Tax=Paenibacillus pectinilyticus TaxID=512399 RepID=A0A1C1A0M6_9BACL|nr:ABC transporter permease [Paenibacillus pectinilyticus]OCT13983.1 D-ala-D-ala transporter subunit [Paenibacillus pectinilyticus]
MKLTSSQVLVSPLQRQRLKLQLGLGRLLRARFFFVVSALLVGFLVVCALVPQWIATFSPTDMTDATLQMPGWAHIFGTDQFGRDIFSLLVYGSRQSLLTGVGSVLIGGLIGAILGLIAGYVGGIIDSILMRAIDIVMAIPGILLAISVSVALGSSYFTIIVAVSVASVPGYARVIRGQVIAIKSRAFIEAARAVGTSHLDMMFKHILPNCLSPLLVMGTLGIGSAILVGSSLSFLGLGEIREIPDWGTLLSQGRGMLTVAWWIAVFPGLSITFLVVSVNLIGDELRNRLDPKGRKG